MTRIINLYSLKGGQGTSTTAVLLARQFADQGQTVLLADRKNGDLPALLGVGGDGPALRSVSPMVNLYVGQGYEMPSQGYDVVIGDMGEFIAVAENYLVIQPDYVSLKRATDQHEMVKASNGVIIVRPADRVLTDRDVVTVLGIPHIATLNMSADVARTSDAGILLSSRKLPTPTIDIPSSATV